MPASNTVGSHGTQRLGWSRWRKGSSRRVSSVHGTSSSLSRVVDLEVFEHFAFGIDDDNGVLLTGPIQCAKTTVF